MDNNTVVVIVVVIALFALILIASFVVFRKRVKGEITGPLKTRLEV